MPRQFLVVAHRVPVSGAFSLNDLAGAGGRMDEVARTVSTAFTLSNDLRRDSELTVLFVAEPAPRARRIRIDGTRVRYLNPDERSTAALLKNALARSATLDRDVEASPGLVVGPCDPARELEAFAAVPGTIWLTERGVPYRESAAARAARRAVLGDPFDLRPEERGLLERLGVPSVSLGRAARRTSQCLDALQYEWDVEESTAPHRPDP